MPIALPMPAGFTLDQWQAVLDACGRFFDGWAVRLVALDWTTLDVFGCHPGAPKALDGSGLLLGSGIIAVTADAVTSA
jgi:hypothetical protein